MIPSYERLSLSKLKNNYFIIYRFFFFYFGATTPPPGGPGSPHSQGFYITHDAPQSVGLLWTSDQLVVETST